MQIWATSDFHFGDYRFGILDRPFNDSNEHCKTIINNYNSLVANDDLVYVVGDVLYKNANPDIYLPLIAQMNGKKILIRGNHDAEFTDQQFSKYFSEIIPECEGVELVIDNIPCYLTHYPSCGVLDRFNLVGHIHSAWKYQLNMLNVGIDVHLLKPVNLNKITTYYQQICDFFDADIWAAYNQINTDWQGKRGKSSQYFKK